MIKTFFTKKIIIKILCFSYIFTILTISPVLALENLSNTSTNTVNFATKGGFNTSTDIDFVVGDIIKSFLSFLGVIFLGLLIYGGFTWMQARGDDQAVNKAKETMINASIGLVIVLGSYALTIWVINNLASTIFKGN